MSRYAALIALALLCSACDLATAPTRITTTPQATQRLQAPTRNTGTLGPALGAGTATNREASAGWFTLVVWDFADGTNQIDLARLSLDAAVGQTVDLGVGLGDDPCKTYQVDIYWLMPRAARYTLSDTMNYPPIASRMVYPRSHCRGDNPPCVGPCGKTSCPVPLTFTFPAGSFLARFPLDYPEPWYPESLGPFAFAVPDGWYRVTSLDGDEHARKNDGPQDERGLYKTSSGQVIGPTNDVPDELDEIATDHGVVHVVGFSSLRFEHAHVEPVSEPTGSFYPVAVTFACVEGR